MTPLEIAGLIGTFLAAVGALITALSNRRSARATDTKTQAEAEAAHINAQSVVIKDLCSEVERLSKRQDELEKENAEMRKANDEMVKRMNRLEKENAQLQRKYQHVLDWATPKGYEPPSSW